MSDRIGVVIADDHPLMRAALKEAVEARPELKLLGEASGGEEALERLRELDPDVALLDVRMGDMDGLQVLGAVKREVHGAGARRGRGDLQRCAPTPAGQLVAVACSELIGRRWRQIGGAKSANGALSGTIRGGSPRIGSSRKSSTASGAIGSFMFQSK